MHDEIKEDRICSLAAAAFFWTNNRAKNSPQFQVERVNSRKKKNFHAGLLRQIDSVADSTEVKKGNAERKLKVIFKTDDASLLFRALFFRDCC